MSKVGHVHTSPWGVGWAARARLPTGGVLLGTAVARAGFLEMVGGSGFSRVRATEGGRKDSPTHVGRRPADWSAGWAGSRLGAGRSWWHSGAEGSAKCQKSSAQIVALLFSRIQLFVTLWTVAHQVPLSMGFYRQEYWSG